MRAKSLSVQLIGICTGSLVVMFGACLYMFLRTSDRQAEEVENKWHTMTEQLSGAIGAQFYARYADVLVFSRNAALQTKNPTEISRAMNASVNLYSYLDLVIFVDINGQFVASSNVDKSNTAIDVSSLQSQNFANAAWFVNTVNERFSEDSTKGLVGAFVEDIQVDPITSLVYKTKQPGLSFSTPVRDDKGKMIGVVSNRSSLRWIENEVLDEYTHFLKAAGLEKGEITLLNKKGEVIIDYDPFHQNANGTFVHDMEKVILKLNLLEGGSPLAQALARNESGTMIAKHTRKGTLQVASFAPLHDERFLDSLGWGLLMRIDESILLGSILNGKELFFAVSGIVLALCVLLTGFFAFRLSRKLRLISENIAGAGSTVDSVSNQLSNASQDLSSGATQVASSLEETVSSLEELTSMVKTNADNAGEAASLAQSSSKIAKVGESEVQNLIGAINEINQSSKKIEEIINVIDDIAFQTNLLALNAAVEAARAGDQGRGFAVVAEAVRNLAQRSGTAAKEITTLIGDNVEKIDRGTKIADRSGQVLQNILASVQKVADLNNEIAAASKEQASGLTQISKAMNEIDQATQRNAAASEQVAASSEQMNGQASSLQEMVAVLSHLVTGDHEAESSAKTYETQTVKPRAKSTRTPGLKRPKVSASPAPRRSQPNQGEPPVSAEVKPIRNLSASQAHAESVIPFGDEGDEPPAKISSTAGF